MKDEVRGNLMLTKRETLIILKFIINGEISVEEKECLKELYNLINKY